MGKCPRKQNSMKEVEPCGACGNPITVGSFTNGKQDIKLCCICEKTANINGYKKIKKGE